MAATAMIDQTLTFLKLHVRNLDQILGHGTLAGDDTVGVNRLDKVVHLGQLVVDGIGAGLIRAVGQNELVAAGLQDLGHAVGQQFGLEAGPVMESSSPPG